MRGDHPATKDEWAELVAALAEFGECADDYETDEHCIRIEVDGFRFAIWDCTREELDLYRRMKLYDD